MDVRKLKGRGRAEVLPMKACDKKFRLFAGVSVIECFVSDFSIGKKALAQGMKNVKSLRARLSLAVVRVLPINIEGFERAALGVALNTLFSRRVVFRCVGIWLHGLY